MQTVTSQKELQEIFSSGLFSLVVESELYSVARAFSILEKKLNHATRAFARKLPVLLERLISALLPSRKGPGLNVLVTRGISPVCTVVVPFLFAACVNSSPAIRIAPPVLRC